MSFSDNDTTSYLNPYSLTDSGNTIEYKPTSDLLSKYQDLFTQVFPNISTDTSTPQGQIITALTEQDTNVLQLIEQMANSFYYGGNGTWLDDWAYMLFRITRKSAVASYVNVTIEGQAGAVIPSGFIVSDGTLEYTTSTDTTIGSSGKVTIKMTCTTITTSESSANSVTQIVTPAQGIFRVNNENNSVAGTEQESDSDLKARCLQYGTTYNNTSLYSIMANVANISGVNKVNGHDNPTNAEVTFNGTTFPAYSFGLVVDGGEASEVAKMIQNCKAPCVATTGSLEVSLPSQAPDYATDTKYNETIKFSLPTKVNFSFSVTITLYSYNAYNYTEIIQNAIVDYINSIPIGGTVSYIALSYAVQAVTNSDFVVNSITFSKKGGTAGTDSINLQFTEMAVIEDSSTDIQVETTSERS